MREKKIITVSVISDLATDQRVIRICTTLQSMGFDVRVIARKLKNSLPLETYPFKATRIRCYFSKGTLQYAEFMTKLFFRLLLRRTNYFLANDLDTLLPNYLVSRLRRKHLFYDTHEYFTGVPELAASPVKRKIWKKLEDLILPRLKTVYTINNSVRDEYQKEYGIPISVVRNVPMAIPVEPAVMPEHWKGKTILLVQGAGLNVGRSCIEMIDAMPFLDDRFHLVFIGGGTAWNELQQRRADLQLENRIDMMDRMHPAKLRSYTLLAHLGISLDTFEVKNYLFCLPNKLFDYLLAGIPVFATAIPEVKNIIDQYGCGVTISNLSPEHIAEEITALMSDSERYEKMKANAVAASRELRWETEQEKLKDIYKPFL